MTDINLQNKNREQRVLTAEDIAIDIYNGTVMRNGQNIYLSMLEYRILLLLVLNKGKVVSRQTILDSISYGNYLFLNENTLTVYIKRIREKLGDDSCTPHIIKTVRGKGYMVGDMDF